MFGVLHDNVDAGQWGRSVDLGFVIEMYFRNMLIQSDFA